MSFTGIENSVTVDDWLISFDKVPTDSDDDKANAERRIKKDWAAVKSDLDGLGGLKLSNPNFDTLVETLVASKQHAIIFELVLTKTEFRLDVEIGNTTVTEGKVKVPSDLEDYRNFLASLNGWSNNGRNIVPDSDFKKFNEKNPKKPTWKDFEAMVKGSKSDTDTFKTWAKTNAKAKKALDEYDKTAKLKSNDKARVAAVKAIDASYDDWLKTF